MYRVSSSSRSATASPTSSHSSWRVTISSCSPTSALPVGVKIGGCRREPFTSPAGSSIPAMVPFSRYVSSPDPVRYPRAMHSTGNIFSDLQIMARPATSSGTSVESTWFGTSPSCLNHHRESCVRTAPLSGISVGRILSKALMRSEATTMTEPARTSASSLIVSPAAS